MESEVYADLLFLVNFSMDFLTLYLVSRLTFRPLSVWRALLSAVLGALYAVAVLFLPAALPTLAAIAIDIGVCLLLCVVGLYRKEERPSVLLRLGAVYLLISALLGGLMTVLSSLLNRVIDRDTLSGAVGEENMTFILFSILAPAAAGVCLIISRAHRRLSESRTVTLHIVEGEQRVALLALCDSGNHLRDPIGSLPVIPVEKERVRPLLPRELTDILTAPHPTARLAALPPETARRCRIIPARSATGEKLLLAFAAEHLYLETEKGVRREIRAYIAPTVLGSKDYAAILPTSLLTK